MNHHRLPLLCALLGIVFLGARLRHIALAVALLGIAWILTDDDDATTTRCERRRRRVDTAEGFDAPVPPQPQQQLPEPPPAVDEVEDEEMGPPSPLPADEPAVVAAPTPAPSRQVSMSGEIVEQHFSGVSRNGRATTVVQSPDLQVLDRGRLPVAMLPTTVQARRLKRVQGTPTNSNYRSTTGQTSSFAHLR